MVTNETRLLYCQLMAHHHLSQKLGRPAAAFARGLSHIIPPQLLRLFTAAEFNELVGGGGSGEIDVADLKRHVK